MSQPGNPPEVTCRVCGDRASGRHYGVLSCDGCRGFFKRSVRRNVAYVCKNEGNCPVDVARRNQCQACRFKRCLDTKMRREAVQNERSPGHPSRKRDRIRSPIPCSDFAASYLTSSSAGNGASTSDHSRGANVERAIVVKVSGRDDTSPTICMRRSHPPGQSLHSCTQMFHRPPSRQQTPSPWFGVLSTPYGATELALHLLLHTVRWVRSVPAFLLLHSRDRAALLEDCWPMLLVLTAAQWDVPLHSGNGGSNILLTRWQHQRKLLMNSFSSSTSPLHEWHNVRMQSEALAADHTECTCLKAIALFRSGGMSLLTYVPHEHQPPMANQLQLMSEVRMQIEALAADHTECTCLKAIALFRSETIGLVNPQQVALFQEHTHVMLYSYVITRHPGTRLRMGRLLLALATVSRIQTQAIQEIFFRRDASAMERLLHDLWQMAL